MTTDAIGYFGDFDTFVKDTELIGRMITFQKGQQTLPFYIGTIVPIDGDIILGLVEYTSNLSMDQSIEKSGLGFISLKKALADGGFVLQ